MKINGSRTTTVSDPIHLLLVSAAFLTYLIDRDDIVWRFIKNEGPETRTLERSIFLAATVLIGIGAYICTVGHPRQTVAPTEDPASHLPVSSSKATRLLHYLGEGLYTLGLASLAPLSGFIILVVGELFRLVWLSLRTPEADPNSLLPNPLRRSTTSEYWRLLTGAELNWSRAIRFEILKWGMFVTMIVFAITLIDRYAEVLIAISISIWIFVRWRFRADGNMA